jgi:hypothetical protein
MNKFHNLVVVIPYAHISAARKQSDCTDSRNNDLIEVPCILFSYIIGISGINRKRQHGQNQEQAKSHNAL